DYVHYFTDARQSEYTSSKDILLDIQQTIQAGKRVFVIDAQDPGSQQAQHIDSMLQSYSMRMTVFSPGKPQISIIR
ncbi:MAG TPA: hypothetical protein VLC28_10750, partial [Flavitalea sp.]|nr:hypothetical protein [Flavitalea sp.]